jgi:sterol O-acyltransferase
MIVHDSLYNYIYVDLRRLGLPQGACFFVTFLVSALVHEYIISLSLKFFYPVLLFMFLGPTIHAAQRARSCRAGGQADRMDG